MQGTNTTEIFDGKTFSSGPTLPFQIGLFPCVAKMGDNLTFFGFRKETFVYDWSSSVILNVSTPLFNIYFSGCGAAITTSGKNQVVVAGVMPSLKKFPATNVTVILYQVEAKGPLKAAP